MRTGSLRRRLALTCLAVLFVAITAFDVFLYTSFDARLTSELDGQLVDRAGLARQLEGELTAQQLADRLAGAGVSASVRQGATTYSGRPQAPPTGPAAPRPPRPPAAPAGTPTDVVRHGRTLTLTETLGDGTLVLRGDRGQIDSDLARLLALEVVGSLVVLAAAAVALGLLVRRAMRPLDEMTTLAGQIAGGRRGGRLKATRTDTELGRMAEAFDAMLDSLEDAASSARRSEERMRTFLGDISHELRTPVAGLVVTAETLLREGRLTDPAHERMLVSMVRESGRAARLIDDLLTLGRLEQHDALHRGPVDLARVAGEQAERIRLLAPEATVTVSGPRRLVLDGDGDRLAQVVANLLDNARHATAPDGRIAISLQHRGGTATLEVTDSGCGVPDGDRERIFERLVRLDPSRSRARFGGGLGLSIARTIARGHGGDLRCLPHTGGARFAMTLPCSERSGACGPLGPAPLTAGRILKDG